MKSYRIEFRVIAYATAEHISPQRIEDRVLAAMTELILDQTMNPLGEAFGYIKDVSVTEMEPST